ncbi:MAG: HPr kinase/phosphorylase [Ignavibacteriales bacterium]|nr:HPr kinase/phosphorylase [Ignavibacteriales bacterium]
MKIGDKYIIQRKSITVDFFYKEMKAKFGMKLLSKKVGFDREITEKNLHRSGLALAGFVELFSYNRIQIFGNSEVKYLQSLKVRERLNSLRTIFSFEIPCIVFTGNNKPSKECIELANKKKIPLFGLNFATTKCTYFISDFLDDQFMPRISMHGSFVDVYGVGMMFIGKSGVGKSEVALDLVERGHRLVADDVVIFTKKGEGILIGSGTDLVRHFMEVRGIGIIDVRSMFGVRSIRFQKRLEIMIELEVWDDKADYTRTGLEQLKIDLMGIDIPYMKLPILPGKNLTVVAEVIALNYLLKHYGYDSAKVLKSRLTKRIKKKNTEVNRVIDYFEHDFE